MDLQVIGQFLDAVDLVGILIGDGASVAPVDLLLGADSVRRPLIRNSAARLCEADRIIRTFQAGW